jgi:hypothetical protein
VLNKVLHFLKGYNTQTSKKVLCRHISRTRCLLGYVDMFKFYIWRDARTTQQHALREGAKDTDSLSCRWSWVNICGMGFCVVDDVLHRGDVLPESFHWQSLHEAHVCHFQIIVTRFHHSASKRISNRKRITTPTVYCFFLNSIQVVLLLKHARER